MIRLARAQACRTAACATTMPSAAATSVSTSPSVTIWTTTRARLAPRAWRTTISGSRIATRAKISVATFAETAASSRNTMAWIARSSSRSGSPGVRPAKARTRVRRCACVAGASAARRAETTSSSDAASRQLAPSARRPNTWMAGPSRGAASWTGNGTHTC